MKPFNFIIAKIKICVGNILVPLTVQKENEKTRSIVISSKKKLAVLLFWLICHQPAFGTSVVIITTDQGIVVVADSSIKHTNSKGQTTRYTAECKIFKQGTVFYIPVGDYAYPSLGYNIREIANKAISSSHKIRDIFKFIEPPVLARMPAILDFIRVTDPDDYKAILNGEPIISIAFATLENDVPTTVLIDFNADADGRPAKPREKVVTDLPPGQRNIAVMGSSKEILAAIDDRKWSPFPDPINSLEHLFQLEIDAHARQGNHDVGPPISVLLISKDLTGTVPGHEGACHY